MALAELDTVRTGTMRGLFVETGHVTFPAKSATVKVPTALNTIFAGMGMLKTSELGLNQNPGCSCDNIIEDGKTTLTRYGGYLGDSPTCNYVLFGW